MIHDFVTIRQLWHSILLHLSSYDQELDFKKNECFYSSHFCLFFLKQELSGFSTLLCLYSYGGYFKRKKKTIFTNSANNNYLDSPPSCCVYGLTIGNWKAKSTIHLHKMSIFIFPWTRTKHIHHNDHSTSRHQLLQETSSLFFSFLIISRRYTQGLTDAVLSCLKCPLSVRVSSI